MIRLRCLTSAHHHRLLVVFLLIGTFGAASIAASSSGGKTTTTAPRSTESTSESTTTTSPSSTTASYSSAAPWTTQLWLQTRRILNLSNTFGSATLSVTPYDRIASHPVFQITTAMGSPYMNMEKLTDTKDIAQLEQSSSKKVTSAYDEQNAYRSVVLYFLDPDDAMAVHGEMKQMESMEKADVRITASSLAKAFRQAANLGQGLTTGLPIDPLDGNLPIEDGGALRYKIVPPRRQLFYAARCVGKERVGLFADTPAEDANICLKGFAAIHANNLIRNRDQRDRKFSKAPKNEMQAANLHMLGHTGIPVFYCPELHKQVPTLKRLLHFNRSPKQQVPLFFNYEDLIDAWHKMRQKSQKIPEQPTSVEVFNLWDVLTSMERDSWQKKHRLQAFWKRHPKETIRSLKPPSFNSTSSSLDGPGLNDITFIPSSRSVHYKESISAQGNGKARLRPMR